jgi:hypothetical protein
MNALFNKIEILKHQTEFQLHVSFIEVQSLYGSFLYISTVGRVLYYISSF